MVCNLSDLKEAERGTERILYETSVQLKDENDFGLGQVIHLSCTTNYSLVEFGHMYIIQGEIILFSCNTGELLSKLNLPVIEPDDQEEGEFYKNRLDCSWLAKMVGFHIIKTCAIYCFFCCSSALILG